jgi:2-polyprenyl-6-methoxyphenol hydroxylase-like FAD-dependent oxidoreductase
MPQWDFLNFLCDRGRRYPCFRVLMKTAATDLIEEGGAVVGVRAVGPDGPLEIRARLTVGCDGRHSVVREKAGFEVESLGAPMDVLWFGVRRKPDDPPDTMGVFEAGHIFIVINRDDYWQCGYLIPKGSIEAVRSAGLPQFRDQLARTMPLFADRVGEITDWEQIKLLTVAVDRLAKWCRPGLLCIGDAAHTMSPVGGVGVNLAVQDAVAAANILAQPLREAAPAPGRPLGEDLLRQVQERRTFPTKVIQRAQLFVQGRVITGVLGNRAEIKPPFVLKLFKKFPILRRLPARMVGIGVRPEHIRTPEQSSAKSAGAA